VSASGRRLQVSPKQKDAILKSQTCEVAQAATGGVIVVLQLNTLQTLAASVSSHSVEPLVTVPRARRCRSVGDRSQPDIRWTILEDAREVPSPQTAPEPKPQAHPQEIDPLYLFACHMEWERSEEPSAGWELLRAAQSSHNAVARSGSAFQFAPSGRNRAGRNTFPREAPTSSGGRHESALWTRHY
jgi:hypothetical protein